MPESPSIVSKPNLPKSELKKAEITLSKLRDEGWRSSHCKCTAQYISHPTRKRPRDGCYLTFPCATCDRNVLYHQVKPKFCYYCGKIFSEIGRWCSEECHENWKSANKDRKRLKRIVVKAEEPEFRGSDIPCLCTPCRVDVSELFPRATLRYEDVGFTRTICKWHWRVRTKVRDGRWLDVAPNDNESLYVVVRRGKDDFGITDGPARIVPVSEISSFFAGWKWL